MITVVDPRTYVSRAHTHKQCRQHTPQGEQPVDRKNTHDLTFDTTSDDQGHRNSVYPRFPTKRLARARCRQDDVGRRFEMDLGVKVVVRLQNTSRADMSAFCTQKIAKEDKRLTKR